MGWVGLITGLHSGVPSGKELQAHLRCLCLHAIPVLSLLQHHQYGKVGKSHGLKHCLLQFVCKFEEHLSSPICKQFDKRQQYLF